MTENQAHDLNALEARSRARLHTMKLDRTAAQAGQRACQESTEDSEGTCRCPNCEYRFTPDPLDFQRVGPEPRDGDGPQDKRIECPGCRTWIWEDQLEN